MFAAWRFPITPANHAERSECRAVGEGVVKERRWAEFLGAHVFEVWAN